MRWFTSGFILFSLLIGSLFLYSHLLKKRAESLIRSSYELSNYNGGPLTLAVVQKQYGGRLQRSEKDCTPSFCIYSVVVANNVLAALRLFPYTELRSDFWIRDGVVEFNMLNYMTIVNHSHNIATLTTVHFDDGNWFRLDPWNDSATLDTSGMAEINSASSDKTKRTVFALNIECLAQIGGCATVADLLPTVWVRTPSGRIASRIASHEGLVETPPCWNNYEPPCVDRSR
jgi:hypothetical protein